MFESKLFEYKKVRLAGVTFVIQKLTPALFLNKEYLFPMSPYIEEIKETGKVPKGIDLEKKLAEQKDRIKELILQSVVSVSSWFRKKNIKDLIDGIMERPFLYNALLTVITQHTLGQKKNYFRLFRSIETLRPLFSK